MIAKRHTPGHQPARSKSRWKKLDPAHPASEFVRGHKQRFGEFLRGLDRLHLPTVHP